MPEVEPYVQGVSSLGASWLWLLLALNWTISAIHVFEEWKGAEFPLWRAFGAVEGVYLPDWLGFASFTVGLLLILWLIGVAGIAGLGVLGPLTPEQGVFWLGAVIGRSCPIRCSRTGSPGSPATAQIRACVPRRFMWLKRPRC